MMNNWPCFMLTLNEIMDETVGGQWLLWSRTVCVHDNRHWSTCVLFLFLFFCTGVMAMQAVLWRGMFSRPDVKCAVLESCDEVSTSVRVVYYDASEDFVLRLTEELRTRTALRLVSGHFPSALVSYARHFLTALVSYLDTSPLHWSVMLDTSPLHWSVILDTSPLHWSVMLDTSPLHWSVMLDTSPLHWSVMLDTSPLHWSVMLDTSPLHW